MHHTLIQWDVHNWNPSSYTTIFGRWWSAMSSIIIFWTLSCTISCVFSLLLLEYTYIYIYEYVHTLPDQVRRLRLYVMGFRADWKALVALFNFERNYGTNEAWSVRKNHAFKYTFHETLTHENLTGEIFAVVVPNILQVCWLCGATKGNDGDLTNCYTNIAPDAGWWATMGRCLPWSVPPSYANLQCFDINMIMPDLLHAWNLGMARDFLGSALKLILQQRDIFTGPTLEARLLEATHSLKMFAKQHGHPLRCKKFTKGKLCWKTRKYPSLGVSGYEAYVIALWLEDVLSGHHQKYPEISSMLWLSNRAISLMYSQESWFLSQQEKDTLEVLGFAFLKIYMSMAVTALQQHKLLWKVRPKVRLLCHVFRSFRSCNPARYSTWLDEDFLRKSGKTLGLTDSRGSHLRFLQRWLMALPGHFKKKLGVQTQS